MKHVQNKIKNKHLSKDISTIFVEVRWLDIEGDDGWSTLEVYKKKNCRLLYPKVIY